MAKTLGLDEAYLQALMELPGTHTLLDLKTRLASLAQWNDALRRREPPPQQPGRWARCRGRCAMPLRNITAAAALHTWQQHK